MSSADLMALTALLVSCVAFVVAVADWLQLGREAPWEVEWGQDGIVLLTRRHYWPVWVEGLLNFSAGPVDVMNPAAHPAVMMSRNGQLVLRLVAGHYGTALTVYYRRATVLDVVKKVLRRQPVNRYWNPGAMSGKHQWNTPVMVPYRGL